MQLTSKELAIVIILAANFRGIDFDYGCLLAFKKMIWNRIDDKITCIFDLKMAAHTPQLAAIGISSRRPLGRQYYLNMKVQRASHCVYQIRYPMVFCIKYRRGLLVVEERCEYLKQVLNEIAERYWFEIEEMGTDGDHIHGAAPKYAPSRVMQILKRSYSSVFPNYVNNCGVGSFGAMAAILVRLETE